jgi:hypothetical protein
MPATDQGKRGELDPGVDRPTVAGLVGEERAEHRPPVTTSALAERAGRELLPDDGNVTPEEVADFLGPVGLWFEESEFTLGI